MTVTFTPPLCATRFLQYMTVACTSGDTYSYELCDPSGSCVTRSEASLSSHCAASTDNWLDLPVPASGIIAEYRQHGGSVGESMPFVQALSLDATQTLTDS